METTNNEPGGALGNGKSRKLLSRPLLFAAYVTTFEIGAFAEIAKDYTPTTKVQHQHYVTYYNQNTHEADSVSWTLTTDMINCTNKPKKRRDCFDTDPDIRDTYRVKDNYLNSKLDKGHLFPYDDASCDSLDRIQCFYMSNMLPQTHSLNAGLWRSLEIQCRKWAAAGAIHIIAGGIGKTKEIGPGKVCVPAFCYKAVLVNGSYKCWIFPNDSTIRNYSLEQCRRSLSEFDEATNLHL